MKSVDEVANSLLHNVYCWKAYYLTDMNALLVLVSFATATGSLKPKVGLFALLNILCIEKRLFSHFFEIIVDRIILSEC